MMLEIEPLSQSDRDNLQLLLFKLTVTRARVNFARLTVVGRKEIAMLFEAKKYHAYARECLQLAEATDKPDTREKLIELSRVWMEAALNEERHHLSRQDEPVGA